MKKIKIMLDYYAYPIWIYDENGRAIGPGLPEKLKGSGEVETLCKDLQDMYNDLLPENTDSSTYIGFTDAKLEADFVKKLELLVDLVSKKLDGQYQIVNDFDSRWRA